MKPIYIKSALFFLAVIFTLSSYAQLGGKSYITSDCASGGNDYYFFDDMGVISICSGCESEPSIESGTYKIIGSKVHIYFTDAWWGEPKGDIVHVSSINHYEYYVARKCSSDHSFTIPFIWFENGIDDSCEEIDSHDYYSSDPHDFLRSDFEGKYPETYKRLLTDNDLKEKSKKELRLMRNEIYARYGYSFKSKDLKAYFESQTGYYPSYPDVEAWLSDIEKKNVKLIQSYEKR